MDSQKGNCTRLSPFKSNKTLMQKTTKRINYYSNNYKRNRGKAFKQYKTKNNLWNGREIKGIIYSKQLQNIFVGSLEVVVMELAQDFSLYPLCCGTCHSGKNLIIY